MNNNWNEDDDFWLNEENEMHENWEDLLCPECSSNEISDLFEGNELFICNNCRTKFS